VPMTLSVFSPAVPATRTLRTRILAAWLVLTAAVWIWSPSVFLPRPAEVAGAFRDLWANGLLDQLLTSVSLNLESIAIATLLSLALAYLGTIAAFAPPVAATGKLRFLSLAGLGFAFTLMTADGHALKVSLLVFFVAVFFVVSMADVIAAIPREQYDLARTLRMGNWQTLWEVVVLGQIDQAFVILRQTAAMSWMMLATAEGLAMSGGGIGVLLNTSNKHFHMAEVMALQLTILAVGLAQDYAIAWLRGLLCPYAVSAPESK
jgi:NitT/TauT family transport system permease protein